MIKLFIRRYCISIFTPWPCSMHIELGSLDKNVYNFLDSGGCLFERQLSPTVCRFVTNMKPFTCFFLCLSSMFLVKAAEDCCRQVYLYSSDLLADTPGYSGLLGIYSFAGEKDGRPYYSKVITLVDVNMQPIKTEYFLTYLPNSKVYLDFWA